MSKKSVKVTASGPLIIPAVTETALAETALGETVTLDAIVAPGEPTEPTAVKESKEERRKMQVTTGSFRLDLKSGEVSGKRIGASGAERRALRAARRACRSKVVGTRRQRADLRPHGPDPACRPDLLAILARHDSGNFTHLFH